MTAVTGASGLGGAPAPDPQKQVRQLAQQLEGVFLAQLFEAMRRSVPQGGAIDPAPGQEMFTKVFDERMADEAARHMSRGIQDALVRQLSRHIAASAATEAK